MESQQAVSAGLRQTRARPQLHSRCNCPVLPGHKRAGTALASQPPPELTLSEVVLEPPDPVPGSAEVLSSLDLIDFPSPRNGRPVYLCWRLDEGEVAYWHELEAGFAGRQKLVPDASRV